MAFPIVTVWNTGYQRSGFQRGPGDGVEALKPRPSGGRKRENMTLEEEKALLARFTKAAGAGEMLNIHDLKAAYEKAVGHETSKSTIYNLLARHGWRKLMPRPFHPRRDIAAQDAFKKWLSTCCEESQAGGRQARPSLADPVRRSSAFRPDQPATAVLGPDRHQARSRLPAHSRIHLFVRRGLSEGWDLRLSDHAEIGYGVLPGLPQRPVAKVCQAGYPLGS